MSEKQKKEYPQLPIEGIISKDSQGQAWKHGIGCMTTHDPKSGEPRVVIGNTWYPNAGEKPAFMKAASSLDAEQLDKFITILKQTAKRVKEMTVKPVQAPVPKPATIPAQNIEDQVEARANELMVQKLKTLGMDDEQAKAFASNSETPPAAVPVPVTAGADDDKEAI